MQQHSQIETRSRSNDRNQPYVVRKKLSRYASLRLFRKPTRHRFSADVYLMRHSITPHLLSTLFPPAKGKNHSYRVLGFLIQHHRLIHSSQRSSHIQNNLLNTAALDMTMRNRSNSSPEDRAYNSKYVPLVRHAPLIVTTTTV